MQLKYFGAVALVAVGAACSSSPPATTTDGPAPCSALSVDPDSIPLPTVDKLPGGTPVITRQPPRLTNARRAQRLLEAAYPVELRDAGIGGVVSVWTLLNSEGKVIGTQLQAGSGYEEFDRAALRVAAQFEFEPALQDGCAVPVWVAFPITFTTRER